MSFLGHPLVCWLPSHYHYLVCAMFHSQTKWILFYFVVGILSYKLLWHAPNYSSSSFPFWVICHPSRTSPLKELVWKSQNRLPPSPYRQTISSFTSDPWPTAPILAGYKWVVPGPYACSTLIWIPSLSAVHAFAIACGFFWFCCVFCCLFLTLCGVDESFGLHSLYIVSSLGWVLLGHRLFFL